MVEIIIGAQWGDEGKGKIIDLLAQEADCVVRFHGGNNAGHTVVNPYGKFPLHLVPCGIFNPHCRVFITGGVVLNLEVLVNEIAMLKKAVPNFRNRLFISPRAHVIMPYHTLLDELYEQAKGKARTGTTKSGIGPVYADKVSYHGIRLGDLQDKKLFAQKLRSALRLKNKIIQALGGKRLSFKKIYGEAQKQYLKIKPYVCETFVLLHQAILAQKKILLEGAQGTFLDNDWGTYPWVTGSNMVAGNAHSGAGIAPVYLSRICGVVKAYTTRVGGGPFPTEQENKIGENLREIGHEYGTTTGRPRRCGWLDLELVKFARELNGFTDLALTKLDVLDGFSSLQVCTGYRLRGKRVGYADLLSLDLYAVEPVYKRLKGWEQSTAALRTFAALPKEAQQYIKLIENHTGVKVFLISVGPERNQTIIRR